MKVLVVGAHPDDPEVMCGGTVYLHKHRGDDVHFIVATNGGLGGDVIVRRKEAYDAAGVLGVERVSFLGMPEGDILETFQTVRLLEPEIKEFDPDVIYTHSDKDRHQDHRNLAKATFSAARKFSRILTCETPSTLSNFSPTIYTDISNTLEIKVNALKLHKSQLGKAIDLDVITGLASFRGLQINVRHAEAFEPYKYLLM